MKVVVAIPACSLVLYQLNFSYGCYQKFNTTWLDKYPWLRYSRIRDGLFCGACFILLPKDKPKDKDLLVNVPFSDWVKISAVLDTHSKHLYHHFSLQSANVLKSSIENPVSRINVMVSNALQLRIAENRYIVQIVRTVLFITKQSLALRGNVEDLCSQKNVVNFLVLLAMLAETDSAMHNHLYQPQSRNATYLSPRSQNEIINVIGYDVICV